MTKWCVVMENTIESKKRKKKKKQDMSSKYF